MHSSSTKGQNIFCAHVLHNKEVSAKTLPPCVIFSSTFLNGFFYNKPDSTLHVLCNECLPYIFSSGSQSQVQHSNGLSLKLLYFFICLFKSVYPTVFFFLSASSAFFPPCSVKGCLSAHQVSQKLKATVTPHSALPKPAQH